jgi:hypothetical protein
LKAVLKNFSPDDKDKIIIMGFLLLIFATITAFSVGTATGFGLAKTVKIQVGFHD